jgi:hypothetical protein
MEAAGVSEWNQAPLPRDQILLFRETLGGRIPRDHTVRLLCENIDALDFIWLVQGRTVDHSTFCGFRTRFKRKLKDIFRQISRVAIHIGLVSLNQAALDGTRVKANSRAHATAAAKTEAGEQAYARRAHLVETPNAVIKQVLGLRQFLFRGLENVRTE